LSGPACCLGPPVYSTKSRRRLWNFTSARRHYGAAPPSEKTAILKSGFGRFIGKFDAPAELFINLFSGPDAALRSKQT
jgi:hypothetical protein